MPARCEVCDKALPRERAELFLTTCVDCSTEPKRLVLTVYSHKTAPDTVVVPANPEAERKARRAYESKR